MLNSRRSTAQLCEPAGCRPQEGGSRATARFYPSTRLPSPDTLRVTTNAGYRVTQNRSSNIAKFFNRLRFLLTDGARAKKLSQNVAMSVSR